MGLLPREHLWRWTCNGVVAASAVLCLAVCALWITAQFYREEIAFPSVTREGPNDVSVSVFLIGWDRSKVGVRYHQTSARSPSPSVIDWLIPLIDARRLTSCPGIDADHGSQLRFDLNSSWCASFSNLRWRQCYRDGVVHFYLLALVSGALPLLVLPGRLLRYLERRRNAKEGLCRVCGYDLRAMRISAPNAAPLRETINLTCSFRNVSTTWVSPSETNQGHESVCKSRDRAVAAATKKKDGSSRVDRISADDVLDRVGLGFAGNFQPGEHPVDLAFGDTGITRTLPVTPERLCVRRCLDVDDPHASRSAHRLINTARQSFVKLVASHTNGCRCRSNSLARSWAADTTCA